MKAKIDRKNNTLVITLPLNPAGVRSSTGKTYMVASSGGSQPLVIPGLNSVVKASLNVFSKDDVLAEVEGD